MKNTLLMIVGLGALTALFGLAVGPAAEPAKAAVAVDLGRFRDLHRQQLELGAQFRLLRDLGALHADRAVEAEKANLPDKARWEAELASELKSKAAELSDSAEALNRQRLELEASVKATNAIARLDADETAYLTRLDTMLWALEEEVRQAEAASQLYSAQLVTNTLPEDVVRISFEVQQNNQVLRFLERDRSMLELKKLEFRALKGAPGAGGR